MDTGGVIGILFAVLFVILLLIILKNSCFVVHQAEGIVIERLGKFLRVLDSGLNFVVPILDKPRQFTWRRTEIQRAYDGTVIIQDEVTTDFRIDLRESVFNFLPQEVYTKDTVLLEVTTIMYFSIFDVKRAIYEVDDLQGALSNTAQTQLKEVFGNMTFSEALESQKRINDHLAKEFSKLFYGWGVSVHRIELLDLSPKLNVREQMKKQMVAERERRGDFIRSEGKKAAMRLRADGSRMVSVNMGLAEQEATRKLSEGESGARVELARAESLALDTVASAMAADGTKQSEYMIGQRYLGFMRKAAKGSRESVVYLPYAIGSLRGLVDDLPGAFGGSRTQGGGPRLLKGGEATALRREADGGARKRRGSTKKGLTRSTDTESAAAPSKAVSATDTFDDLN